MMEENGSKKILLSVLGVAILVVAVVGISFAAFSYTGGSNNANSLATGTITMSYSEGSKGINLTNALPMSDTAGKALTGENNVFEFSVATNASGALDVPYEINITPVDITTSDTVGALQPSQVKVYLTKDDAEVVAPTLISDLTTSTVTGRNTSLTLLKVTDSHDGTATAKTANYVLRMWIDGDVSAATLQGKTYEYRLKVNVDSTVGPLGA